MNKVIGLEQISLLVLSCAVFLAGCQREYSYEGGITNNIPTGTSVFTLAETIGACDSIIVTGQYYQGTPLAAGNAIQIPVNVSTAGTYNLKTNSANGIYFSASGAFSDTGIHTITLAGSGTPSTTGNFAFSTSLGCTSSILVTTIPEKVAVFTMLGAPNDCKDPAINGVYTADVSLTSLNTVVISVDVTATGTYTLNTDTIDGISFSAAGAFTTTGIQNVTLIGTGTPISPRNLVFTPLSVTAGCTFQVAVVNKEPLATYVLESSFGDPNPCIYNLTGNYVANTPLSGSDSVSISVYVTVIGNFTIATDIVNGMTFSYTGSFATLGAQYVTLAGSGTPVNRGSYTLIPQIVGPHPLGGATCSFKVEVQ